MLVFLCPLTSSRSWEALLASSWNLSSWQNSSHLLLDTVSWVFCFRTYSIFVWVGNCQCRSIVCTCCWRQLCETCQLWFLRDYRGQIYRLSLSSCCGLSVEVCLDGGNRKRLSYFDILEWVLVKRLGPADSNRIFLQKVQPKLHTIPF